MIQRGKPVAFCCAQERLLVNICFVKENDCRLANDLSLVVMRLARQLRFRRPDSSVSLSQLSALSTLANEGAMTPGALAVRERVRPPSMTRVIASLAELGVNADQRNALLVAADLMSVLVNETA